MDLLSLNDFKRLNGLSPTINSTFTKLEEEKGEVAEIVGKLRKMNGEKTKKLNSCIIYEKLLEELMDISQVCATMIYILTDSFNILIDDTKFHIDNSCSSFSYLLKKISIVQGNIASLILYINDDEFINKDLAIELIPLLLEIFKLSCSCIYFVSIKSNKELDIIKSTHINKLMKRGYLI
ncbi:MAG: hypothetical protein IJH34_08010 [Romboutsia sp.]|nr:hypothetical protein [Romboutsia sp.]